MRFSQQEKERKKVAKKEIKRIIYILLLFFFWFFSFFLLRYKSFILHLGLDISCIFGYTINEHKSWRYVLVDIDEMSVDEQILYYQEKLKELRSQRACAYCGKTGVFAKGLCVNCYHRLIRNGMVEPKKRGTHEEREKRCLNWKQKLCSKVVEYPFAQPIDFDESVDIAIGMLINREQDFLLKRYKEGMTLKEIGTYFGVSQERARQVINRSIQHLRHPQRIQYFVVGKSGVEDRKKQEIEEAKRKEAEKQELRKRMGAELPIEQLDLSVRTFNILCRNGVKTLGDIDKVYGNDGSAFMEFRNCGRKTVNELEEIVFKFRNSVASQISA